MNLLTAKQIAVKLGITQNYVYHLHEKDSAFPRPFSIGMGTVEGRTRALRWVESEVDEWILAKQQQSHVLTRQHTKVQTDEDRRTGEAIHPGAGA